MIKYNYYYKKNFTLTHEFAEKRTYGLHCGNDYVSKQAKHQEIYNLIDGLVVDFGIHRDYGNYVLLKHNPKFLNGLNVSIYSKYCHLSKISHLKFNNFCPAGSVLGFMGNTGYCLTYENGKYRHLSHIEIENPKEKKGVHLHLEFSTTKGVTATKLLQALFEKEIINDHSIRNYFTQWNRTYFDMSVIWAYFHLLWEAKHV